MWDGLGCPFLLHGGFMFNISLDTIKTRLKIPLTDKASEPYLASLDALVVGMCEGLLRSSLRHKRYQDVFALDKARMYKNLPNGRFPLLLSSGFVTGVEIRHYHRSPLRNYVGDVITNFEIDEIDREAGLVYVPDHFEGQELAITFTTGQYDYPLWVQELYLQNLEYSRSLPNEGSEKNSGEGENHRQVISTLLQRNRRPLGNKLTPMFTKELEMEPQL